MGDAILYAEPVFLKPETLEFPELRRIILADARQVVMQRTLDASVAALTGELPAVAPVAEAAVPGPEEAAVEPAAAASELVDRGTAGSVGGGRGVRGWGGSPHLVRLGFGALPLATPKEG
jgi:uncharacterized membrane protein (UPF0182 family)